VQRVKLARSGTYVSPRAKAEAAKKFVGSRPSLGIIQTPQLGAVASSDHIGAYCVLVAEQTGAGVFEVVALVRSQAAINTALSSYYTTEKTSISQHAADATVREHYTA
jgi:hypothetical protein